VYEYTDIAAEKTAFDNLKIVLRAYDGIEKPILKLKAWALITW